MKDSFKHLKDKLFNKSPMSSWDAYNLTIDFFKIQINNAPMVDEETIQSENNENVQYLDRILQIHKEFELRKTTMDWSTDHLGTFFYKFGLARI